MQAPKFDGRVRQAFSGYIHRGVVVALNDHGACGGAFNADLVAFILQRHGRDALQRIIGELSSGTPFPLGIRRATGRSVEELDMEWRGGVETSLLFRCIQEAIEELLHYMPGLKYF